jgi:hypothetical protein
MSASLRLFSYAPQLTSMMTGLPALLHDHSRRSAALPPRPGEAAANAYSILTDRSVVI